MKPESTAFCPFGYVPIIVGVGNNADDKEYVGVRCDWVLDQNAPVKCGHSDVVSTVRTYLNKTLQDRSPLMTEHNSKALKEWLDAFPAVTSDSPTKRIFKIAFSV